MKAVVNSKVKVIGSLDMEMTREENRCVDLTWNDPYLIIICILFFLLMHALKQDKGFKVLTFRHEEF